MPTNKYGRATLGQLDKWRIAAKVRELGQDYAQALLNQPYTHDDISPQVLDRLHQTAKSLNRYNAMQFELEKAAEQLLELSPAPKRVSLVQQITDRSDKGAA